MSSVLINSYRLASLGSPASTGFLTFDGFTNDAGIGTKSWSNPNRATLESLGNTISILADTEISNWLKGLNITGTDPVPSGATITGFEVRGLGKSSLAGEIDDHALRLVIGGTIQGTNPTTNFPFTSWGATMTIRTWGGVNDMWGVSSVTPAQANAADFGIAFSAISTFDFNSCIVDYKHINVHYLI